MGTGKAGWIGSLEGLRAVAALTVVLHHTNISTFSGVALANIAVAVFFALSGFLTYRVLEVEQERTGRISYLGFMLRRVRRIWPLYFAVIGLVACAYIAAGRSIAPERLLPLFTFTVNFDMAARQFPPAALTPLWSIAVEMHYYLLAPFVFMAMRSRYAVAFCGAAFVISNLARISYLAIADHGTGNGGLYYLSFAYLDTFIAGVMVARWRVSLPGSVAAPLALILLAFVGWSWGQSLFPPYPSHAALPYAVLPFAGAAALVACQSGG